MAVANPPQDAFASFRLSSGAVGSDAEQPGDALESLRSFACHVAGCAQYPAERGERPSARFAIGRQQIGNGGERRLLIDQQHVVLLPHERLELGQGQLRLVVLDAGPQTANGREPAFVGSAARHADVKQAADKALAQAPVAMRDFSSAMRDCRSSRCSGLVCAFRNGRASVGSMPTAACNAGEP